MTPAPGRNRRRGRDPRALGVARWLGMATPSAAAGSRVGVAGRARSDGRLPNPATESVPNRRRSTGSVSLPGGAPQAGRRGRPWRRRRPPRCTTPPRRSPPRPSRWSPVEVPRDRHEPASSSSSPAVHVATSSASASARTVAASQPRQLRSTTTSVTSRSSSWRRSTHGARRPGGARRRDRSPPERWATSAAGASQTRPSGDLLDDGGDGVGGCQRRVGPHCPAADDRRDQTERMCRGRRQRSGAHGRLTAGGQAEQGDVSSGALRRQGLGDDGAETTRREPPDRRVGARALPAHVDQGPAVVHHGGDQAGDGVDERRRLAEEAEAEGRHGVDLGSPGCTVVRLA